jgi:hypothetical protein
MKGILHKEEYGWVVRYKKEGVKPWFELPLHPNNKTENLIDKLEVEFEIVIKTVNFGIGSTAVVDVDYAWIMEQQPTWNDILTHFYENYDSLNGRDWDKFMEYLEDNYNPPTKKLKL